VVVTLSGAYEPFGDPLFTTGSGTSIYAFTNEQTDAAGLLYLRARYCGPEFGRFLSRDVWEGDPNAPISLNEWQYAYANPVTLSDPAGLCVHCRLYEGVRFDARRDAGLYSTGDPQSSIVGKISDNQYVMVLGPVTSDGWRQILVQTGGQYPRAGWVRNIYLLDNCQGSARGFACIPVGNWSGGVFGFGPNADAQSRCSAEHPENCPYMRLRRLHNGVDFDAPIGSPVIWPGARAAQPPYLPDTGDGNPNFVVVSYEGFSITFSHLNRNVRDDLLGSLPDSDRTLRPGQQIATTGNPGEGVVPHLHFGVRNGPTFYNPVYSGLAPGFASFLLGDILAGMRPYPEGHSALHMLSFEAGSRYWSLNFWRECPPYPGILFREDRYDNGPPPGGWG
jgi:RHS repeat-associated protein